MDGLWKYGFLRFVPVVDLCRIMGSTGDEEAVDSVLNIG